MSEQPQGRFAETVVLVTGAARGIGAAICVRLAAEGATIAAVDLDEKGARESAARLRESGARATGIGADVTSRAAVEGAVSQTVAELGRLDGVVSCAGIVRDNLIHKLSDEDWDAVVDTHLRGGFLVAQAAQREMVPQRRGRIVFLSSGSARGSRGQANYAAAKAGIEGLTRTLALELGRFCITVNAVAPGFVETQMTHETAERIGIPWEEFVARESAQVALGRIAQPDDIAGVIAFLLSDDAAFVTGQTISVRGGP